MRLILQRRPGAGSMWLTGQPFPMEAPPGANLLGLHLPAPARSSLVATTTAGIERCDMLAAGWVLLPLPGHLLTLHAEGAPFRISGAPPACRFWEAAPGLIREADWRAARFLGDGAVLALAGGVARPFMRLGAGETGWITLPPLFLPGPVKPILAPLRGPLPLAELSHAAPTGGPLPRSNRILTEQPSFPGDASPERHPLTLTLRAGAACEVLWEGVQLRPNSFANSA